MWTNEREKLSFQFAKYGLVNTNIFDVASSNGRTYLFLKTTSFISKRKRSKNFRSSVLLSALRLQCFCSTSYAACHACALSSVYLLFIFVQFEFCLFVLNNMFTIKDTKLLTGRGLRDATDVVHPCKKEPVKP